MHAWVIRAIEIKNGQDLGGQILLSPLFFYSPSSRWKANYLHLRLPSDLIRGIVLMTLPATQLHPTDDYMEIAVKAKIWLVSFLTGGQANRGAVTSSRQLLRPILTSGTFFD